jgi:uncharacterized protein
MTRRRWLLLAAAGVAALFLGRWLAVETAERAWALGLGPAVAAVQGEARALSRLVRIAVFVVAALWGVGNLYLVYRAIGSVQVPRRLGDLEIVEAVSHRLLLAGTILAGLVIAVILTLGTGDWWLMGALARAGVTFGVTDHVLHRDLGYYVASLPLEMGLQEAVLVAVAALLATCTLLYYGIGSIRFAEGRLLTSSHARSHLGALMCLTALALAWGASLQAPIWVAGLRGPFGGRTMDLILTSSWAMLIVACITGLASLLWSWWGRHRVLAVAWGALFLAWVVVRVIAPTAGRGSRRANAPDAYAEDRDRLTRLAYDLVAVEEESLDVGGRPGIPATHPAVTSALQMMPLWDPSSVSAAARADAGARAVSTVSLTLADGRGPQWLVTTTDTGASNPLIDATEPDTGRALTLRPGESVPVPWLAPGLPEGEYAVVTDPSSPARRFAVPINGWWRRLALAWTLQAGSVMRARPDSTWLVWRRDVRERLRRLAPFAVFGVPTPLVSGGDLYWVAPGYSTSATFPLAPAVPWGTGYARYVHAGFLATVHAHTGETRIYLAPRADSLSAAWARAFAPLVLPTDSLPGAVRAAVLPYPVEAFRAQSAVLRRLYGGDAAGVDEWRPVTQRDPYQLLTIGGGLWTAQAFVAGARAHLAAIFGATTTPAGPRLRLVLGGPNTPAPPLVTGSRQTTPGPPRVWAVLGTPISAQALFHLPQDTNGPLTIDSVFLMAGSARGSGPTAADALSSLVSGRAMPSPGTGAPADPAWARARALLAKADSALQAGDLAAFARAYEELKRVLGVTRPLARPPRPR